MANVLYRLAVRIKKAMGSFATETPETHYQQVIGQEQHTV